MWVRAARGGLPTAFQLSVEPETNPGKYLDKTEILNHDVQPLGGDRHGTSRAAEQGGGAREGGGGLREGAGGAKERHAEEKGAETGGGVARNSTGVEAGGGGGEAGEGVDAREASQSDMQRDITEV